MARNIWRAEDRPAAPTLTTYERAAEPEVDISARSLLANAKSIHTNATGGSSGEPPNPVKKTSFIYGMNDIKPGNMSDAFVPEVKVQKYVIGGNPIGGAYRVMYESQIMTLPVGKVMTESSSNLDWLRRQGVVFVEMSEGT